MCISVHWCGKDLVARVAELKEDRFEMLLFAMILLMGSFDIKEFIKKPAVIIVAVIIVLGILFSIFFGGGGGQDPTAKSVKNLSNRHQALITLIDQYSPGVKSATLKANLSQVSIILTADKNDVDAYSKSIAVKGKKVTTSYSSKPAKELIGKLDKAKIANNLDSEIKAVVRSELESLNTATQSLKKNNPDKEKLVALVDKLTLNNQTMLTRLGE